MNFSTILWFIADFIMAVLIMLGLLVIAIVVTILYYWEYTVPAALVALITYEILSL